MMFELQHTANTPTSPKILSSWKCLVCDGPTNFYTYGARVCRGCGAFYRRWCLLKREYACRGGNFKCPVKNADSVGVRCKACRLMNCFKAGLPIKVDKPTTIINEGNRFESVSTAVASMLVMSFKALHRFQRQRLQEFHPKIDFGKVGYIPAKKDTLTKVALVSVPKFFDMLCDAIKPLGYADYKDKARLVIDTQFELHLINEFYLSSLQFKDLGDTRSIVIPGYFLDVYEVVDEYWFTGRTEQAEKERLIHLIYAFTKFYVSITDEFRNLKIDETEVCIIMFLALCRYSETSSQLSVEMGKLKDRMMAEFGEILRKKYQEKSLQRLCAVLLLCDKITVRYNSSDIGSTLSEMLRFSIYEIFYAKICKKLPTG